MATIGFIGTGGMGSEMAANLKKAGHSLVVNDVRPEMTRRLQDMGAQTKDSARDVAESSEVVYSMLPYNEAVTEVGVGKGGLHEATGGARLWVDFSSTNKKTIVDVSRELSGKGWNMLDASVAGVEEQAAAAYCAMYNLTQGRYVAPFVILTLQGLTLELKEGNNGRVHHGTTIQAGVFTIHL